MNLKNKPKRSIYQPIMGIPVIILLLIIAAFGIQFSLKKHYPERYQKELDIVIVEEVILPDSITAITAFVFSDETKKLKKVTIPASVTDIDDLAFASAANLCKQLTIVTDKGSAAEAYAKKHKIKVEYLP